MKSKMLIATLLGCLVWQQGVLSQTDTTATATNQNIGTSTINPPMAPAVTTNESTSAAASSETAAASAANPTTAPAATTNESPGAATSSEPAAATTATPATAPAPTATESPAAATPPPAPAPTATESPAAATPPPAPAATVTETTTTVTPPPAPAATVTETTTTATPPPAPAATVTETTTTATPPPAPAATVTETTTTVTPPPAPAPTATESPAAATPPLAPAPTATESPAAATSNETAGVSTTNPPTAPAVTTNESAGAAISNATAAASSGNPQPSGPASIPLIQFQDVPITTAIENLTRQAGINYLLDPKIGYGQPDQNGQVKPEPTLSIRWENITAGQALLALLDNYGLQITEDHRTHISRITTKDPTAPPPLTTRVFQIKYAGTSNLLESIQASFTDKRSKVLPDVRTSQLVVVATENEQEALEVLISQLDKPTRQVLIETKLIEISSSPSTSKGVNWAGTLAAQNVSFGNGFLSSPSHTSALIPGTPVTTTGPSTTIPATPGSTTTTIIPATPSTPGTETTVTIPPTPATTIPGKSTTTTPSSTVSSILNIIQGNGGVSWNTVSGFTPAIGFLNADGVNAVLSFLNEAYDAQIMSTPRLVTLDNQMATIEVTRTYPVISMTGGTQNSAGSSSVTYSNVGTILQVTPRISANDYIWLRVIPVVSDHYGDELVTMQGGSGNPSTTWAVPIFDLRKIDSQVMVPDGDTLVMGGLIQDNPSSSYTKVPLLGDIPGLGWVFRSESKSMNKDNLIIFMTPTIIKDTDFQPATSAPAEYLQSKPAVMKSRINPHSIWDGATPRGDWSNPAPIPGEYDKN
jgi:type IV pilus assembly protein PilQ